MSKQFDNTTGPSTLPSRVALGATAALYAFAGLELWALSGWLTLACVAIALVALVVAGKENAQVPGAAFAPDYTPATTLLCLAVLAIVATMARPVLGNTLFYAVYVVSVPALVVSTRYLHYAGDLALWHRVQTAGWVWQKKA